MFEPTKNNGLSSVFIGFKFEELFKNPKRVMGSLFGIGITHRARKQETVSSSPV